MLSQIFKEANAHLSTDDIEEKLASTPSEAQRKKPRVEQSSYDSLNSRQTLSDH